MIFLSLAIAGMTFLIGIIVLVRFLNRKVMVDVRFISADRLETLRTETVKNEPAKALPTQAKTTVRLLQEQKLTSKQLLP